MPSRSIRGVIGSGTKNKNGTANEREFHRKHADIQGFASAYNSLRRLFPLSDLNYLGFAIVSPIFKKRNLNRLGLPPLFS